jgi:hypothetical protein
MGFEPTIPASERAKIVYALDRSATVTGPAQLTAQKNKISSFINLSCHLKKQVNHRSTLKQLTLGNYTATQL